jgi:hypothetical protein
MLNVVWVKGNDFIVGLKDEKGKVEKRSKVRVRWRTGSLL